MPQIEIHLERRPNINAYYQMYRDVAKERKLLLIDHHPNWIKILESDKELFDRYVPDGIHPGPGGEEPVRRGPLRNSRLEHRGCCSASATCGETGARR